MCSAVLLPLVRDPALEQQGCQSLFNKLSACVPHGVGRPPGTQGVYTSPVYIDAAAEYSHYNYSNSVKDGGLLANMVSYNPGRCYT